jgi:hypothetical protein
LSAWYVLVLACGLGAFSIAAWFAMRASLDHAIEDELQDRVRGVSTFMRNQIASLSVPEIRDEFREHSVLGPGRRPLPGLRRNGSMAISVGRFGERKCDD